jgi:hypothetical protein
MKIRNRSRLFAVCIGAVVAITALTGAAKPDVGPSYTPASTDSPFVVTVTDTGYTLQLTSEAARAQGVSPAAAASLCEGTYFLQKVNGTLEWGSQNVCSPDLPAAYAPQRIDVTLEGTCTGPFCLAWPAEAGPITSGWTYSRVATATTATTCDSNESRRFRIAVHLQYEGGGLDAGTIRSAPWDDVSCDV